MTLQQLKYVVTASECGNLTEASKKLFISQPSLTNSIKELEKEINITLFTRTNKGIILTKDGEIFLGYARSVLEQMNLLEDRYICKSAIKHEFCVSAQHYSFVVDAFADIVNSLSLDEYDVSLRETQTYEIIKDVADMKSEIGVLYTNHFNKDVIFKIINENNLVWHELTTVTPHVFISSSHPLASKEKITQKELLDYPYLSFEQGDYNSFYFSEEIFSTEIKKKNIRVRDRASLFNLLVGANGYTVCSGIINPKLNGDNIISIPLAKEGTMNIGYITHKDRIPSLLGNQFILCLKRHCS